MQFKEAPGIKFPQADRNEIVIRIQPKESIYLKLNVKKPGLSNDLIMSELDLSYASRYGDLSIPEAYESLLLDASQGDQSNFVRDDELVSSWKIFDELLGMIDKQEIPVHHYPFGSRGPSEADEFVKKAGFVRSIKPYTWEKPAK